MNPPAAAAQRGAALGGFLRPEGYDGPRGLVALSREGSTAVEVARHLARRRTDRRSARALAYAGPHRRAAVEPVLLVPGFMAGDLTLRGMSDALRSAGMRTYRSQIRVNVGCTREAADRLERRVEAIAVRRDRKVSIVGHSLGGMLARGLAARRPDLVAGIVTMGSPVLAPGAVHRLLVLNVELLNRLTAAGLGGLMSADCTGGECARLSFEESQLPLEPGVGFTAIHSKRDGVVDWRACLDPGADEQVEVRTSHCGMAVDPVVIAHVVRALRAQQAARGAAAVTASAEEALRAAAVAPLAGRR
ncbi:MAG: esterase/lipase family protein [Marmoricola sp.]